jgi:GTP-binding protein SAR1
MGVFDWACLLLSYVGFFTYIGLSWERSAKLLLVGLDNAGKSSLLQFWADFLEGFPAETLQPGAETLVRGKVTSVNIDVGCRQENRELRTESICGAMGVVFMVDAHDFERFAEAAAELQLHALSAAKELKGVPFLVLGNKIDLPDAGT